MAMGGFDSAAPQAESWPERFWNIRHPIEVLKDHGHGPVARTRKTAVRSVLKPEGFRRTAFVALAALALAMLALVPPGYMIAGGANASPPRIVICTGPGPVLAAVD